MLIRSHLSRFCKTMSTFNFCNYDVVGFDLDNTLLQYKLRDLFKLQYEFLSKYLTEVKGYSRAAFPTELKDEDADFIERGLFLDCTRGNVLYMRHDGFIIKASHGTKLMTSDEIEEAYGRCRIWPLITKIANNKLALWDCEETRTFLDFTDSIATLVFAKAVDSVDLNGKCKNYNVWPDLLEAIVDMYKDDSSYIQSITSDPHKYMISCDETIIEWLRTLKKHTKVILITGAEYGNAQVTLPLCLGPRYKELFDLIIIQAKKPGFFTMRRSFQMPNGNEVNDLILPGEYMYGNWEKVHEIFKKVLKKEPKCVYVGDNPLQDIYAPSSIPLKLDTVALVEEVAGEGLHPEVKDYPYAMYVSSKFWGPFLDSGATIIGDIIRRSAKLVIPSIKVLASKPINYEHISILNHDS